MAKKYELSAMRKFVNRMMTRMVKWKIAPPRTYLLGVAGRKTGKIYYTPVTLVENEQGRWLVSPYGQSNWVKNARVVGEVSLSLGKNTEYFAITELDSQQAARILKEYVVKEGGIIRPYFDAGPDSSLEEFEAEAHLHPVFHLEQKKIITPAESCSTCLAFLGGNAALNALEHAIFEFLQGGAVINGLVINAIGYCVPEDARNACTRR